MTRRGTDQLNTQLSPLTPTLSPLRGARGFSFLSPLHPLAGREGEGEEGVFDSAPSQELARRPDEHPTPGLPEQRTEISQVARQEIGSLGGDRSPKDGLVVLRQTNTAREGSSRRFRDDLDTAEQPFQP